MIRSHGHHDGREQVDGLRRSLLAGATALPVLAACWSPDARSAAAVPSRARGGHRVDVRASGAVGDGVADDTSAIQRAIDALPDGGGTVHVPAGLYAVDATRNLRLRSRMHLELANGAQLVALGNAAAHSYVVLIQNVSDVEVSGGRIRGERTRHLGRSGEWGHGVTVRGASRVTIRDLQVSDCWGDGISIGSNRSRPGAPVPASQEVVVARVVCTGNRRQGLTIGRASNVRVQDCEFSGTAGTPPAAGIDIEPDDADSPDGTAVRNVAIARCLIHDNRGPGIQIYKRARDIRIEDCTIRDNGNSGILAVSVFNIVITSNRLGNNRHNAVDVRGGSHDVVISGNRFGAAKQWQRQIRISDDSRAITLAGDNRNG
jgi:polygalacturonase